jgi:hypothetical protein
LANVILPKLLIRVNFFLKLITPNYAMSDE